MIISNQNTVEPQLTETQQQRQEKKDVQKSSDRFASILDGQKKQQQQFDKVAESASKEQVLKRQEKSAVTPSAGSEAAADSVGASPARQAEAGNIAEPAPAVPPDISKLAEEFGHQIELHQVGSKTQVVDITFHSKTLPGLKVQIRHTKGQLAIRFLSQSVSTTQLLSTNASTNASGS
jgi:hypothetical protein